jgi:hypothetical protein
MYAELIDVAASSARWRGAALVSRLDRGQHSVKFRVVGHGLDATYTTVVAVV